MGLIEIKLSPLIALEDLFDQFPLVQRSPYPLLSAVPGKYIPETVKTVLKNEPCAGGAGKEIREKTEKGLNGAIEADKNRWNRANRKIFFTG
jgi:hypothetical protein